jgi:hypothetical protein
VPWDKVQPFEANDAFDALWVRFGKDTPRGHLAATFDIAGTLALVALLILPVIAEIVVVLTLARTVGLGAYWVWTPAILLVLVTWVAIVEFWRGL